MCIDALVRIGMHFDMRIYMFMRICYVVHVDGHVDAHIDVHRQVHAYIHVYKHADARIRAYRHVYACIHVYRHVYACIHLYIHVCDRYTCEKTWVWRRHRLRTDSITDCDGSGQSIAPWFAGHQSKAQPDRSWLLCTDQ